MKRVLFLFSDTGGGHRAAAEAIRDALLIRYPSDVNVELVDVFRTYLVCTYPAALESVCCRGNACQKGQ